MNPYCFKLSFSRHEHPNRNLPEWIETLTGRKVTVHHSTCGQWWHSHQGCEVHFLSSRSDAILFYNLMLQHFRIEPMHAI